MPRRPARLDRLVAALGLGLLAAASAQANIEYDFTAQLNTELVFVAWDENSPNAPKVSFVKDLGISMANFFVGAQQDAGSQYYWYLGAGSGSGGAGVTADTAWDTFLNTQVSGTTTVDPTKIRWAVVAYDVQGDLTPGTLNLYTTWAQGRSGDPTVITGLSDADGQALQNSTASWFSFIANANGRGTNQTQDNGSAVITVSDSAAFICSPGNPCRGSQLTYNNNFPGRADNAIGQSSWFYALTSSDPDFSDSKLAIDEFDNLGADGYWGFTAIPGSTQYFLSYTLPAFASATEQAAHVLYGNNFARLGGALSLSSPAGKASSVLGLTEDFLRGLTHPVTASVAAADAAAGIGPLGAKARGEASVSVVPEPATACLHGLGLAVLVSAAAVRRRRAARR
jgi:hypothetical protein